MLPQLEAISHCRSGRAPEAMAGRAVNGVPSGNGAVPILDWSTVPLVPPSPLLATEEGDRTAHKRELHTVNVGARERGPVELCSLSAKRQLFFDLTRSRIRMGRLLATQRESMEVRPFIQRTVDSSS